MSCCLNEKDKSHQVNCLLSPLGQGPGELTSWIEVMHGKNPDRLRSTVEVASAQQFLVGASWTGVAWRKVQSVRPVSQTILDVHWLDKNGRVVSEGVFSQTFQMSIAILVKIWQSEALQERLLDFGLVGNVLLLLEDLCLGRFLLPHHELRTWSLANGVRAPKRIKNRVL